MGQHESRGAAVPRALRLGAAGTAVTVLLTLLAVLGVQSPATGVVHGLVLARGATAEPWAVAIYYDSGGTTPDFGCSGTLVGQQLVVTAAHCVRGYSTSGMWVQVGSNTLGGGRRIAVDGAWWHPKYSPRYLGRNDIAVLHLLLPAGVRQVATLSSSPRSGRGTSLLLGWGADEHGRLARYLRAASVSNLDAVARRFYGRAFSPTTMLAAGRWIPSIRRYAGACSGDSGGPLVQYSRSTPVLVGVVSFGRSRCDTGPSVFVRVSAYRTALAAGIAAATAQSRTASLAAPVALARPVVSGTATVGQTLTCTPGRWTANARRFVIGWQTRSGHVTGAQLTITRAMTGGRVVCDVTAVGFRRSGYASAPALGLAAVPTAFTWITAAGYGGVAQGRADAATDVATPRIAAWCVVVDGLPASAPLSGPGTVRIENTLAAAAFDAASGCFRSQYGDDLVDGFLSFELVAWPPGTHTVDVTVLDGSGRPTAAPRLTVLVP